MIHLILATKEMIFILFPSYCQEGKDREMERDSETEICKLSVNKLSAPDTQSSRRYLNENEN